MLCSFRPITLLRCGTCILLVFGIAGGCSPEHYKAQADEEVYKIIDDKWQDNFGRKANYMISDVSPSPNDLQVDRTVPKSGVLTLAEAVNVATAYNRGYQRQKEQLYLTALDLTLARHDFARQWFGTIDAGYTRDSEDEGLDSGGQLGFSQLLADGAQVSASIAIDWTRFLTGDPRTSLGSVLSASVRQPLLRGRGRKIVQEQLTQAERDALYEIRAFNRYRKEFVVSIVAAYYRVLQRRDEVTNAQNNYDSRVESRKRLEMEAEAGRKPRFEVDQARQSELSARDGHVRAEQRYEQQLDEFKIMLSLPTDANVELDQGELNALKEIGVTQPDYTLDAAVETGLLQRLDLANSRDAVEDAERKVVVAADNIGAGLDLIGGAGVGSTPKTDYSRLQFHRGTYDLGLEADLPLDRKAERNAYRAALIAFEQSRREHENYEDLVKLDVRQAYRQLLEAAESYGTRVNGLQLAQTRVESTRFLLEAGRVTTRDWLESQDALLAAQNSVIAALVDHAVAKLSFFRDIGLLQVRPDGMWEESGSQYQADIGQSSVASAVVYEKSATHERSDWGDMLVQSDAMREESAEQWPVDFRDFLVRHPRIWEQ